MLVAYSGYPPICLITQCCHQCQRIDEDIIVLFCFIVHEVSADAKIKRASEIRSQSHFLIYLPGMLVRNIFSHNSSAATQLRITEVAGGFSKILATVSTESKASIIAPIVTIPN